MQNVAKDIEMGVTWAENNPQTVQYVEGAIAKKIPAQDRPYAEVGILSLTAIMCVLEYKYGYTSMIFPLLSIGVFFALAIQHTKALIKTQGVK